MIITIIKKKDNKTKNACPASISPAIIRAIILMIPRVSMKSNVWKWRVNKFIFEFLRWLNEGQLSLILAARFPPVLEIHGGGEGRFKYCGTFI